MRIINYLNKKINDNFPILIQIFYSLFNVKYLLKPMEEKFSSIVDKNFWGPEESFSGAGSTISKTKTIRKELPILLEKLGAKSLLDVPCGDFNWMRKVDLKVDRYIGGDIVPKLIQENRKKYQNLLRKFKVIDITKDKLPQVDIIFCRDGLVHLSNKKIFLALRNFKDSLSKYLLTTTFTSHPKNRNIITGGWRPLNFQLKPFYFPKPISIINEKCDLEGGKYVDKCLGLWKLEDIN